MLIRAYSKPDPKMVDFTTNLINAAKDVKHIVKFSNIRAYVLTGITITRLQRQAKKDIEESGIPSIRTRLLLITTNFCQSLWSSYQGYWILLIKVEGMVR